MTFTKLMIGISALLFSVIFINVSLGAFARITFLSDLGDAIMLLIAAITFAVGILAAESKANEKNK